MKRKRLTMSIIDCYIAVLAVENRCILPTLDGHFRTIKKFISLELLH